MKRIHACYRGFMLRRLNLSWFRPKIWGIKLDKSAHSVGSNISTNDFMFHLKTVLQILRLANICRSLFSTGFSTFYKIPVNLSQGDCSRIHTSCVCVLLAEGGIAKLCKLCEMPCSVAIYYQSHPCVAQIVILICVVVSLAIVKNKA